MIFTSIEFQTLLGVLIFLFWLMPKNFRPFTLIVGSFVFYSYFNLKYSFHLFLTVITNLVFYEMSFLSKHLKKRKVIYLVIIFLNLVNLLFFKYFIQWGLLEKKHYLYFFPLGISFYTFQVIGLYREHLEDLSKEKYRWQSFILFMCYFPQMIAGPIEKASSLMPQLKDGMKTDWNRFPKAIYLFLVGMLLKTCVSDQIELGIQYVRANDFLDKNTTVNLVIFYFYPIKLFSDFFAYTLMARGSSLFLGIKLHMNFNRPYRQNNPRDFWRNWHMTIYRWFLFNLYIPINRILKKENQKWFAVFLVFLVSGFWHGVYFNYVIFGIIWALLYFIYERFPLHKMLPKPLSWLVFFHLIVFTYIVFHEEDLLELKRHLFTFTTQFWRFSLNDLKLIYNDETLSKYLGIALFFWCSHVTFSNLFKKWIRWKRKIKTLIIFEGIYYYLMIYCVVNYGTFFSNQFYYFRF